MDVRQAVVSDLESLVPLFDAYRRFYGQPSDLGGARSFLADRFEHLQSVILLASDAGQAIGFVQLFPSFSSTRMARILILNDLFVRPESRGLGAARALLASAVDHGRRIGAVRLTLSTAMDNETAQKLYESAGWTRDTRFYNYDISTT